MNGQFAGTSLCRIRKRGKEQEESEAFSRKRRYVKGSEPYSLDKGCLDCNEVVRFDPSIYCCPVDLNTRRVGIAVDITSAEPEIG